MVPDERLQPLDRVGVTAAQSLERALGACQDAGEAALLDAVQQLFLAADVVVHPGERHPRGRGEVAHRGGVVALVGEHLRRPGQEVVQPLVVGAHSSNDRSNSKTKAGGGGGSNSAPPSFNRIVSLW